MDRWRVARAWQKESQEGVVKKVQMPRSDEGLSGSISRPRRRPVAEARGIRTSCERCSVTAWMVEGQRGRLKGHKGPAARSTTGRQGSRRMAPPLWVQDVLMHQSREILLGARQEFSDRK